MSTRYVSAWDAREVPGHITLPSSVLMRPEATLVPLAVSGAEGGGPGVHDESSGSFKAILKLPAQRRPRDDACARDSATRPPRPGPDAPVPVQAELEGPLVYHTHRAHR
jgi:hypothetical protein